MEFKELHEKLKDMPHSDAMKYLRKIIEEEQANKPLVEDPIAYAYRMSDISPKKMFQKSMKDLKRLLEKNGNGK